MPAPRITRRYFLQSSALPLVAAPPVARRKILIMLVDGFDPAYFDKSDMPNLRRMIHSGGMKIGQAVIPTVTNVNNASLVTRSFPSEHGIVSNYFYDQTSGRSQFMETPDYLLRPTIFEQAKQYGMKSALVSAKDKVRTLLGRGADVALSVEKPSAELNAILGSKAESIYSAGGNYSAVKAARHLLSKGGIDLLYLSTTDYMMHTYGPEDARSLEHCHTLDNLLGEIIDDHPRIEFSLTADHGMNAKTDGIDLGRLLGTKGISCEAVPIIRDQHVVHHQNLGGACYIYLHKSADYRKAEELLRETKGVEEVYGRREAALKFRLLENRIGDLFVLGAKEIAFGSLGEVREGIQIRTHGSRHEVRVPLIWCGRKLDPAGLKYNLDLTRSLDLQE